MNELKKAFLSSASKVILGKERELEVALCALLSSGHILIEDIPGVGKTTFAKTLSKLLGLDFKRIQFTSDLMPSDILGAQIYNQREATFSLFKGPIFNSFILADELNRASPKTQSAMLEAMEEKQVTIDKETFSLPNPFFVIATQNPNNQIGTNLLPESQLDRFMIKLTLGFPHPEVEKRLILGHDSNELIKSIDPVFDENRFKKTQDTIKKIQVSEKLSQYILSLVEQTRTKSNGPVLSPRAAIDLARISKSKAFLEGREFVLPDDVKYLAPFVFSHRLLLSFEDVQRVVINNVSVD